MSEHFIEICRGCGGVIAQCRCPGPKETRYGVCPDCAKGTPSTHTYTEARIDELEVENEQLKRDVTEWKTAQRECIDALGEIEDRETALTAENQRLKNLLTEWVAPMDGMDADEFVANVAARIKETRQALETEAVKP